MPAKKKATKEQLREAILRGMNYTQIAGKFGYASEMSARSAVWLQGLNELYKEMKGKRERKEMSSQEHMTMENEMEKLNKKNMPLFETRNGKVVINNLHLILGHVEPYLPAKLGKVG